MGPDQGPMLDEVWSVHYITQKCGGCLKVMCKHVMLPCDAFQSYELPSANQNRRTRVSVLSSCCACVWKPT